MNLSEILEAIDGPGFDALLNAASGFAVLRLALEEHEVVQALILLLKQEPPSQGLVFEHLLALLPQNDQPEYAHPYDAALAGYLYALSQSDSPFTRQAIEAIWSTPRLWWSARLAQHLQEVADSGNEQVSKNR